MWSVEAVLESDLNCSPSGLDGTRVLLVEAVVSLSSLNSDLPL